MQGENEVQLPLFIDQEEPILVYVVNNKLLRFYEHYKYDRSFGKAFYFLYLMNNVPKIKLNIPKKLSDYLKEDPKVAGIVGYPLIGEPDYTTENLDAELKIITEEKEPIIIHNIKQHTTLLKDQIRLTEREAFYIFANICTNARCDWFREIMQKEGKFELDIPSVKEIVRKNIEMNERLGNKEKKANINAYSFMLVYLDFLKEQLQKKTLTIRDVLRLSGARVVAFLAEFEPELIPIELILETLSEQKKLHINEKIMYYTLFEIYEFKITYWRKDSDLADNFSKIYKEKRVFIKSLRQDIKAKIWNIEKSSFV